MKISLNRLCCMVLICIGGLSACKKDDSSNQVSPVSSRPTVTVVAINDRVDYSGKSPSIDFAPGETFRILVRFSGSNLRVRGTELSSRVVSGNDTVFSRTITPNMGSNPIWKLIVSNQDGADSLSVNFQITSRPSIYITSVNGKTNLNGKDLSLEFANGDTVRLGLRFTGTNLSIGGSFQGVSFPTNSLNAQDTVITSILSGSIANNSVWKLRVSSIGGTDSVQVKFQRTMARYSAVLLQAPSVNNTTATFINLISGTTYNVIQASSSPSNVDLGFAVGNTVGGLLMAPDNWFTGATEPYAPTVAGWVTRNATQVWLSGGANISDYLSKADLATAFNNGNSGRSTNTSYVLSGASNSGLSGRANSRVGNLTTGSTLVFKTVNNKHGIMTIGPVSIGAGRTGEVRITYKIEQ